MTDFYNSEQRLIATDGDACAIWSEDKGAWKMGTADLARECWVDLRPISKAQAAKQFPDADLGSIPDLTEAKAAAEAAQVPIPQDELDALLAKAGQGDE